MSKKSKLLYTPGSKVLVRWDHRLVPATVLGIFEYGVDVRMDHIIYRKYAASPYNKQDFHTFSHRNVIVSVIHNLSVINNA